MRCAVEERVDKTIFICKYRPSTSGSKAVAFRSGTDIVLNKMPYYIYILHCADGSYYTGSTADLSLRLTEHQEGSNPRAYTYKRRPVKLAWATEVETKREARLLEHQIKGWSRNKKEALIRNDFDAIHNIVRNERKEREKIKKEKTSSP